MRFSISWLTNFFFALERSDLLANCQEFVNVSLIRPFFTLDQTGVIQSVQMPLIESKQSQLSVVEVDDPKLCVLIHLMTQMEPIEPVLESPLSLPLVKQKTTACDLLSEVGASRTAMEGMLLSNLEKNGDNRPFLIVQNTEFGFYNHYM